MKIAVVGYFGFYGSIAEWVADAWEANGHVVQRVDRKRGWEVNPRASVWLYVDCSEDYSGKMGDGTFVNSVTKKPIVRAFWSLDAHMPGGIERSVNIARKCDLTFSTNHEHGVNLLSKFGIDSYLLPVTYNDRLVPDKESKKDLDVVMIGNPNSPERAELWSRLKEKYKCVVGRIESEAEYIDAMQRAKIVINQPTEPWNNILNNRLFEGMGFGAAVLQKKLETSLVEKLGFADSIHFQYWSDFKELFEKVDYLLANDAIRQEMAWQGNEAVQKYSMKQQCLKMESVILSKFYDSV